jgi:hypothetical protein
MMPGLKGDCEAEWGEDVELEIELWDDVWLG